MEEVEIGFRLNKKTYQLIFALVWIVFFAFNLVTLPKYGITWDEPLQHQVGAVAVAHLSGKTSSLESDEVFQSDGLIYYGPFFEELNYFATSALNKFTHLSYVDASHFLIILTAALGLIFFFLFVSQMFNEKIGLFASVFLMLMPRFVAHAHYNSKEIPLAVGFIIVFYFLYLTFTRRKAWQVIVAGIMFGLTLATRIDAIIILPVFFLAYLCHFVFERKFFSSPDKSQIIRQDTIYILVFLFVSAAVMFGVWPELWRNPALVWESLKFFLHHIWGGDVLYLGHIYSATNLPWHYAPVYLALTTPFVIALSFLAGVPGILVRLFRKEKIFEFGLLFFWIAVRLGLAMIPHAVRYDGMRHYLPIVPAIAIVAAVGLDYFLSKFSKKILASGIVLTVILASLLIGFFTVFPYGDSYFNEVARLVFGPHLETRFEIEYWGSTYRQGVDWLNLNAKPNSIICVPVADHLLQYYPFRTDLSYQCNSYSKYLMFFTRYTQISPDINQIIVQHPERAIYKISRYNSDLLDIYQLQ